MRRKRRRVVAKTALLAAGAVLLGGCVLAAQLGLTQYTETIYDRQGVQPGQRLGDMTLYSLRGRPQSLAALWRDGPVLLVSGSYTCPVSRRTLPQAAELAGEYRGRLQVWMVYVYEPHPLIDPAPYTGRQWVTVWNYFAGILHRQPRSLEQRLALAERFNALISGRLPILVDSPRNTYWHQLGEGPNPALLVARDGTVLLKQGWFHRDNLRQRIDPLLTAHDTN